MHDHAMQLLDAQRVLEEQILAAVREFEKLTGMVVKNVKVYPGEWHNGKPIARQIEVGAQLR